MTVQRTVPPKSGSSTRRAPTTAGDAYTIDANRRWIEYRRSLDESSRVPGYYPWTDHGDGFEGFYKVIEDEGDLVVIRQIDIDQDGIRRYWWQVSEDERGGLADQPLPPDEEGLLPISAEEFESRWTIDRPT
ncbi:MAG: hypothetical protein ACRDHC_02665 [Actinomycetota bacterium]